MAFFHPPSTVDITLYGASGDTYFNLCGNSEAYEKTVNGIECLLKYGINTRIKTTIVRSNLSDYDQIKKYAESLNLEFLGSSLIHGNRDNGIDDCAGERLSSEEIYGLETKNN